MADPETIVHGLAATHIHDMPSVTDVGNNSDESSGEMVMQIDSRTTTGFQYVELSSVLNTQICNQTNSCIMVYTLHIFCTEIILKENAKPKV